MSDVALVHVPGHVGRGPGRNDTELKGLSVQRVDLCWRIEPPRHPGAAGLIVPGLTRHRTSPSALTILTKKNFGYARDDGSESRRITVLPVFPPAEFLEPGEALSEARDVQNRGYIVNKHRQKTASQLEHSLGLSG